MATLVEAIGTEFSITSGAYFPDTAVLTSGNIAVSFLDVIGPTREIQMQVYDPAGNPVGARFVIPHAITTHSIASLSGGGFVLSYSVGSIEGRAQVFDPSGNPVGAEIVLRPSERGSSSETEITSLENGGFAATWTEGDTVVVASYDVTGDLTSSFTTNGLPGTGSSKIVELADGNFAVIWHELDSVTPRSGPYADGYQLTGQIFSPAGSAISGRFIVNASQSGSHSDQELCALSDGRFVVTWTTSGNGAGITAQIYSASGQPEGSNFTVSDLDPGYQSQPTVAALPNGGFIVSWTDHSPSNPDDFGGGIRAQIFDSTGARIGDTLQVSDQRLTPEDSPTIVVTADNEVRIFYESDALGLTMRTIALPRIGTEGADLIIGTANTDRITGRGGPDQITGGDGDDYIEGNSGNDDISGGAGADTILGGIGNDTLSGGSGDDTYFVDSYSDMIVELRGEGTDTVRTTLDRYSIQSNLENLAYIGSGAFRGTGDARSNYIQGGNSNDRLDGGAGADVLSGGQGDDTYVVDHSNDAIIEIWSDGTDTVLASADAYRLGDSVENLFYTGNGDFRGTGNVLNNRIRGGQGNDRIDGGYGADILVGGMGDDIYFVENTSDHLVERAEEGLDRAISTARFFLLPDFVENLTIAGNGLTGVGNGLDNEMTGNALGNLLRGRAGNDNLFGAGGADTLVGGMGSDTLTGGTMNDSFHFTYIAESDGLTSFDLITDFNQSQGDRINLFSIDASNRLAGNQAFNFVGTLAFSQTAGELRYSSSDGTTLLEGDVNGDGTADFSVQLTGTIALVAADFVL